MVVSYIHAFNMSGTLLNVSGVAGAILYTVCKNKDHVKNHSV